MSDAFNGKSASDYGGRWNSPGTGIVYTASSASLALLEVLVHLGSSRTLPSYALIKATFDDDIVLQLDGSSLPTTWRDSPPPYEVQAVGDAWAAGGRSAVLAVPSVVIPQEANYLINPLHPDFPKITLHEPSDFPIDDRLALRSAESE